MKLNLPLCLIFLFCCNISYADNITSTGIVKSFSKNSPHYWEWTEVGEKGNRHMVATEGASLVASGTGSIIPVEYNIVFNSREEAIRDFQSYNPTYFSKEPKTRPYYIPQNVMIDNNKVNIIYNKDYQCYGYFDPNTKFWCDASHNMVVVNIMMNKMGYIISDSKPKLSKKYGIFWPIMSILILIFLFFIFIVYLIDGCKNP